MKLIVLQSFEICLFVIFQLQTAKCFFVREYTNNVHYYTHFNITRGALEEVAAFYIATYLKPGHYDLSRQNAEEITGHFFRNEPDKETKYREATKEILAGLDIAQRKMPHNPKITMNNEEIEEGSTPDWKVIRSLIGEFLFTLQNFYGNTNWIELGGSTHEHLGWNNTLGFQVATTYQITCKDCEEADTKHIGNCEHNIILPDMTLTSGYIDRNRHSLGGIKPISFNWPTGQGKCSHGGQRDATRSLPAKGGINKETNSPMLSPHYHLHQKAGVVATNATGKAFIGNETSVMVTLGLRKVGQILGVDTRGQQECWACYGSSLSLAFVVDTTGSMSDEIEKVKSELVDIVSMSLIPSVSHPYDYILTTFNDPAKLTKTYQTKNGTEMVDILRRVLIAGGGGDCPEYMNSGLIGAMEKAQRGSCVILFTDDEARDPESKTKVKNLIHSKNLTLIQVISGKPNCGGEIEATGNFPKCSSGPQDHHRVRREALNSNHDLGFVMMAAKKDIAETLRVIIEHNIGLKYISVFRITLARNKLQILVDTRITAFTVEIKGLTEEFKGSNRIHHLGRRTYKMGIIMPTKGIWVLENEGTENWVVTVKMQGNIKFTHKFLEDFYGSFIPIEGTSPLAGSNLTLEVEVEDLKANDSLEYALLLDTSRTEIDRLNLTVSVHGWQQIGIAQIQIPNQPFKVVIAGTENNNSFQRELEDFVYPTSAVLSIADNDGTVYNGKIKTFVCTVTNSGVSRESYQLKTKDTAGFVISSSSTQNVIIDPGSSKNVMIELQGRAFPKTSVMYIRLILGDRELQKLSVALMVQNSLLPDLTALRSSPNCANLVLNYFNCSHQSLTTTVNVDAVPGIDKIYKRPALDIHKKDGIMHTFIISGTCCMPKFTLFVVDKADQVTERKFDFTHGQLFLATIPATDTGITKQNFNTTSALFGVLGGVAATLIIGVMSLLIVREYNKSKYDVSAVFLPEVPDNKAINNRQKMTKEHLDLFIK